MAVVLTAELWSDEAPLDEAGRFVVEEFGDFLSNEFELVFVLFVSFGEEGLLDDFKLIPAFEAAVIFILGLFVCGFCFVGPLRFWVVVSRGGVGLFRREAFKQKLELGGVDLLAFDSVEDLEQSIDFLLQEMVSLPQFCNDAVFFVGCLDGLR